MDAERVLLGRHELELDQVLFQLAQKLVVRDEVGVRACVMRMRWWKKGGGVGQAQKYKAVEWEGACCEAFRARLWRDAFFV